MAQTIKLKRSALEGVKPGLLQLSLGEVAINTFDGKMYIKKDNGVEESIVQIGDTSSYLPLAGGTLTGGLTGTTATFSGEITANGGNSTNWNTAYTYSQVGHVELDGTSIISGSSASNGTRTPMLWMRGRVGDSVSQINVQGANIEFGQGGVLDATPAFTFAYTGVLTATGRLNALGGNSDQWNTAYGWGNHASAGYLTSYTDTNTTYSAGTGISLSGTTFSLTDTNAKLNLSGGTMTGALTTANSLKVTGIASSNSSPAADQVELSGYGLIGNRSNLYVTNANASGQIVMGISGAHNANPKLTVTTSGITVGGTVSASGGNSTDWNTAYSWGNHASQSYATQAYVGTAISNLVDSSPAALDTLNELAAALGDDPNFATTVTTSIATKLPLAGGTLTGALTANAGIALGNTNITGVNALSFNDPGPDEGIAWSGGNTKIYESPDDLTTNTAGNLQFVYGSTRRLTVNSTGIDVTGTATMDGLEVSSTGVTTAKIEGTQAKLQFFETDTTDSNYQVRLNGGDLIFNSLSDLGVITGEGFRIASNGDISFYEDTGTTPKLTWSAAGEDLNFGDNVKATFGASDDLQIYHDGSNSYIREDGVGSLRIQGADLELSNPSEIKWLKGYNNNRVELFFNNSLKLSTTSTGIDVTGTATMDGLTVDGESDLNATITITHANPRIKFIENDSVNSNTQFSNDAGDFAISTMNDAENVFTKRFNLDHATGAISFYEDTGTAAKFHWDASAERLGIGTSSPSSTLHVKNNNGILVESTGASTYGIYIESGYAETMGAVGALSQHDGDRDGASISFGDYGRNLTFNTGEGSNNAERMRIDSSGNVGIGTSSPSGLLDLTSAGPTTLDIQGGDGNSKNIVFRKTTGGTQQAKITVVGDALQFFTGPTDERVRIDQSGNLLVGKTASSLNTTGIQLQNDGLLRATKSGADVLQLNRQSTDGAIATFYKDGTTVGSINCTSGRLAIGNGNTGLKFGDADNSVMPFNVTTNANRDAAVDLGYPSVRFKDLYLSNKAYIGSGSLFDTGGDISLNQGSHGIRINDAASAITPTNGGASNSDATTDLGISNIRFKDLYLSGTANVGSLSAQGGTGNAYLQVGSNTGSWTFKNYQSTHALTLEDSDGTGEVLRVDTSGNLLVGKTAADIGTVGHQFLSDGSGDYAAHTSNGTRALLLNRKTSDGEIIDFRKDGATVGSIGTDITGNAELYIQGGNTNDHSLWLRGGDCGIRLDGSINVIVPTEETSGGKDDKISLGKSNFRFKDLHLSGLAYVGGVYNTGIYNQQSGDIQFWVTNVGEAVRIQQNTGNVGIGTSSPAAKLHVKKASAGTTHFDGYATAVIEDTEARLQIISDDGGNNASSILLSNETKHWAIMHQGPLSNNIFSIGYDLTTATGTDIVNTSSHILNITTGGNVGIGTTTPGYKLEVAGSFAATTKSFVIDHPTKEGMKLRYGSLEGPENGVYVRGRLKDLNTIELPDYWTGLVHEDSITVSLTAIGKSQELYVIDIIDNTVIIGGDNINCFYTIFAERKDVDKLEVEYK